MPNIPYIDPTSITDPSTIDLAERIKTRRIAHGHKEGLVELDRILLHAPAIASGWNEFLGAVRNKASLTDDVREIIICRVAVLNGAEYEWGHHAPILRKALLRRVREISLRDIEVRGDGWDGHVRDDAWTRRVDAMDIIAAYEEALRARESAAVAANGDEVDARNHPTPAGFDKWMVDTAEEVDRFLEEFKKRKEEIDLDAESTWLDDEELFQIRWYGYEDDMGLWPSLYQELIAYVDAMTRDVKVPENIIERLKDDLLKISSGNGAEARQQMVEITATCAAYNCVSRFLVAMNVGDMNK